MTYAAVFVDAGYLYTGGAVALTGSARDRTSLTLRQQEIIEKLRETANQQANGAPLLRIYWYDGLRGGRPSSKQETLAYTDDVKLRLGVVSAGRQKGVDSLIITDLIELARNHAISDAVLLSGDEDLRVGVQIAQSFGVRVHLIGIEPSRGNQSRLLMQEADTTIEWSKDDIRDVLSVVPVTTWSSGPDQPHTAVDDGTECKALDEVATEIAGRLDLAELKRVAELLSTSPEWIPPEYDKSLLAAARERIGRDLSAPEKRRARDRFKEAIRSRA